MIKSEYIKLSENLPLSTPLMVIVDPSNVCNFRCSFCPTGDKELLNSFKRPEGLMDLELFHKIIDDISKFKDKVKTLQLHKDGEPFLNKNLFKMVAYAKSRNIAQTVALATNGSLLNESAAAGIIDSELDRIRISVEQVTDSGYKRITKTYSDYQSIKKNVGFLFKKKKKLGSHLEVQVKIIDAGLSDLEKRTFLKDFSAISDRVSIDNLMGWSLCNEKNFMLGFHLKKGMNGKTRLNPKRKVCPIPFYTLAVNFNGKVSVCCVDWSWSTVIGDVNEESLADIWNGKKMKEFRLLHLRNLRSEIKPCAHCQYLLGLEAKSDLDVSRSALLKKFSEK